MEEFAVLRTEWAPAEAEVLGPILEEVLELVRYDAMHQAAHAQGIVAQNLPGEQAIALAKRCTAAGMPARAVPQADLAVVGVPVLVRTVRFDPDGLGVVLGYTGPERVLPWNSLRLLSAGVIEEVTVARAATPRKSMGIGGRIALYSLAGPVGAYLVRAAAGHAGRGSAGAGPAAGKSKSVEMADLFFDDPEGGETLHLRLRGPDLYYEAILGDERHGDHHLDFRQVLLAIAEHAGEALVSESTRALLLAGEDDTLDPRDAEFASPHELARYNVWHLQMLVSGAAD